jgi:hypothetical protein
MLYQRCRREEFLKGTYGCGGFTPVEECESLAAGFGEIDGTDKRHRNQNNEGSEKGINNHKPSPEELEE